MQTGYRGRVPVVEWIRASQPLRNAIRRQELEQIAPVAALEMSSRELLRQGVTNDAEYERTFGL